MPPDDLARRRWAQSLYAHLTDSGALSARALRQAGWFDFIRLEELSATDAVEYGADALIYMGYQDGRWVGPNGICVGVIAFIEAQTAIAVPREQLRRLGALLDGRPVEEAFIRRLLRELYGSD